LARLLQGFSAGGDLGAATTYLLEMAPPERRGYYASWQSASQALAILVGGLLGYGLSHSMSHEALMSWGWRIPFLLGLLIAPVGMYIRSQLEETMDESVASKTSRAVMVNLFTNHLYDLVVCSCMIVGGTVSVYIVSNYMTTYALTVLHLPTSSAMLASIAAGVTGLFAAIYGGQLSDRFGRKKLMIIPLVALILAVYPAFLIITKVGTPFALLSMVAVLTIMRAMGSAVVLVKLAECFPPAVRSSGVAIAYALAVTIFGGSTQPIITWLIHATGNPIAPAWYLIAANLVTLIAILCLRDRPADA